MTSLSTCSLGFKGILKTTGLAYKTREPYIPALSKVWALAGLPGHKPSKAARYVHGLGIKVGGEVHG